MAKTTSEKQIAASLAKTELERRKFLAIADLLNRMSQLALDGSNAKPARSRKGIKIDLANLCRGLPDLLGDLEALSESGA